MTNRSVIITVLIAFLTGHLVLSQDNGLPEEFPEFEFLVKEEGTSEGYLFIAPFEKWGTWDNFPPYMIIMDDRGTPVFYESTGGTPVYDFKLQPNGMITFYGSDRGTHFHIMDSLFRDVSDLYGDGSGSDFHELVLLENGNYLMISWDDRLVDMDTVIPGGHKGVTVRGNKIQEFTVNNELVREYNTWDYYEITDTYEVFVSLTDPSFIDFVHLNAIELDTDTTMLLCPRNLNEITRVDRVTGEVIWRLGGKNNMFTFINDDIRFSMPHDIRKLPDGNIQLFDNGVEHSPQFSSVIEYEVDEAEMTATLVSRFRSDPDDIFGLIMGSARRLENGNVLAGWGSGSPNLTEFRPDSSKVLEISFEGQHYRAFRYSWEPKVFSFETDTVNFGEVLINSPAELEIRVTNNYHDTVQINNVVIFEEAFEMPSGQLPLALEPDSTGTLILHFNPSDTGQYRDRITVCYDHMYQERYRRFAKQLTVEGYGWSDAGLDESRKPEAKLYPNPGHGLITLESKHPVTKVIFRDTRGSAGKTFVFGPSPKHTISARGLSPGLYLVEIHFDNGSKNTLKYLKE